MCPADHSSGYLQIQLVGNRVSQLRHSGVGITPTIELHQLPKCTRVIVLPNDSIQAAMRKSLQRNSLSASPEMTIAMLGARSRQRLGYASDLSKRADTIDTGCTHGLTALQGYECRL